jgi:quercetin dioxygenase-like cupin family protein
MMALNEFAPGTSGKLHSHPQEQLVFLMEGEADLVLGNQTLAMKAGDVAVVASDVPHTLQVKGTKACTSLEIFSPIPDKFLSPPK